MREVDLDMHRSMDQLGKFSVNLKIDSDRRIADEEVESMLKVMLERVGRRCLGEGAGMIGHIKACAHGADERVCTANLTNFKVGVESENRLEGSGIQAGYIMLHVIVHGLWDPQVRELTLEEVESLMAEHDLSFRVIRDYYETDKRVS